MDENETQIRVKVAKEISRDLKACLENCVALGGGEKTIENSRDLILKKIISGEKKRKK